ncbi:hypothetical protein F5I97DRAFT_841982 [Phlebopus sp. FC_14]|nr:hypothetical protein F5I97DRAFT_841982 [Phlebopus sp. FC_14]
MQTLFLQFLSSLPQLTQSSPNTREQTNTIFPIAVAFPPDHYAANSDESNLNGSPASIIAPESLEYSFNASRSTASELAFDKVKELPSITHLSDVNLHTNESTSGKFEGCCSTSSRMELLFVQDAKHEHGNRIDPDPAGAVEDEILIPVATTYADATNLAVKYPDLASKILVSPLHASSDGHRSAALTPGLEGSDQTMPGADNVGATQNRESSDSRSEVYQCRGNVSNDKSQGKPVMFTGKLRAWSSQLEGNAQSMRTVSSGSGATGAEKKAGTNRLADRIGQKFNGAITSESPTPTRRDLPLQNSPGEVIAIAITRAQGGRRLNSRTQTIGRQADALRRASRRSLEPPRDCGASGEPTGKRVVSARAASARNTSASSKWATTVQESKGVLKMCSPVKRKHATQRRTEANATREDPVPLRSFDCMLGSHVLHGDNLALTVGPISVLGEDVLRQSTSNRVHGVRQPANRTITSTVPNHCVSRAASPATVCTEELAAGKKMPRLPVDQSLNVSEWATSRRRLPAQTGVWTTRRRCNDVPRARSTVNTNKSGVVPVSHPSHASSYEFQTKESK